MQPQQSPNMAASVAKYAADRVRVLARGAAAQVGKPIDSVSPTQDEQARMWAYQDPQADLTQVQALVDAGQHQQAIELLFPHRMPLIGSGPLADRVANAERLSALAARQTDQQEGDTNA